MTRLFIGVAALLLAGCSDVDQAEPPTPIEEPASAPAPATAAAPAKTFPANAAITEAGELVGEYRVAGVNGRDIDLPHGITARINPASIHVTSDCVNVAWSWFLEGTRLVTERVPVEGCGRGFLPEEEAIVTAVDSADKASRTPANGLEFSGGGHSVLLFGQ
jgi:hypothetical protein